MIKAAVILFPGTNCELETVRACELAGIEAKIIRWNTRELNEFDIFILPGGFSYEDRIRAGVISAHEDIVKSIKKEASNGKVVLGICNGAQILVESGLIPGLEDEVEMALAPNINPLFKGFYCTWVYIKHTCKTKNAFNLALTKDEIIPVPIAHAEGRFTTRKKDLLKKLIKNDQIIFRYCNKEGNINKESNPNGSLYNIAGICNKEGNVLAMMPHPERASWLKQLPYFEGYKFKECESKAPAHRIFESIKLYLEDD